ncbi:hypothetical protein [Mycobacterium kyogaense]|uniref:hypothetical protein n=1 Tax=Mycobacterium kyogaense TaxID=2212479 RepID=UPI000DAD297F|nr:hypothetical protein [Mycobacterium kyogaense]
MHPEGATSTFADQVKAIVGRSLSRRGFTFDRAITVDEDGRNAAAVFFRNRDCLIQIYWSQRAGELNCMIAPPDAAYEHGLYDRSAKWRYLNEFVARPDFPLEQLTELLEADKVHFQNQDTWLTWLGTRIDDYYDSALAGIKGRKPS